MNLRIPRNLVILHSAEEAAATEEEAAATEEEAAATE